MANIGWEGFECVYDKTNMFPLQILTWKRGDDEIRLASQLEGRAVTFEGPLHLICRFVGLTAFAEAEDNGEL